VILELRGRELVVLGAVLSAGLAGTAVALAGRGADEQFLQDQRHPPKLQAADVERVVKTAPDPAVGKGGGVSATCTTKGSGRLKNPWTCVVRYPSGKRVRIAVRIKEDGYYAGRYAGGGAVTGCCIDVPGTR
jgi:hypothetical protein